MKSSYTLGFIALAVIISLGLMSNPAQAKRKHSKGYARDVEYNATANSPTLPLIQTPPPQNYPTSVQIGTPSYYYYYPPMYGAAYGGGYAPAYGNPNSAGVSFYNAGGATQRTFYYNTQIPGQVSPYGYGGGGYGGLGGFGGSGGMLYIP